MAQADPDPDGNGLAAALQLRFPGQYADVESGSYYNYFRDYDPVLGRYVQSDPLGALAELNGYAYAKQNPLNRYDVHGLQSDCINDGDPPNLDCRQVKKHCRAYCSDFALPTLDYGISFFVCYNKCTSAWGCGPNPSGGDMPPIDSGAFDDLVIVLPIFIAIVLF